MPDSLFSLTEKRSKLNPVSLGQNIRDWQARGLSHASFIHRGAIPNSWFLNDVGSNCDVKDSFNFTSTGCHLVEVGPNLVKQLAHMPK